MIKFNVIILLISLFIFSFLFYNFFNFFLVFIRKRSPFCHEHLRKEYFTVSSNTMQLNMNVGFGPVKTFGNQVSRKKVSEYETFKDFTITSKNDSNIEKHPWYNLPDDNKISALIKSKRSMGAKYLHYDPSTAVAEARKNVANRAIPNQFRNKRKRSELEDSESEEPVKKRRKLDSVTDEEKQRRVSSKFYFVKC